MPFSTDATWPIGLRTMFDISRQEHQPLDRYYGPYTTLLTYCFGGPDSFDFFVAPQAPEGEPSSRDPVNSIVYLVVFDTHHRPVLMADIKEDRWVNGADLRLKADRHMRQGFNAMIADCPLPRLWGLSLLGTSLRVYVYNVATRTVEPPFIRRPSSSHILPPNFLEGAWDIDILSQEGFSEMKEIVEDIVTNATALEEA